jgi:hypothetical protein
MTDLADSRDRAKKALEWVQSDEGMQAINDSQDRAAETARKLRIGLGRPLPGDQISGTNRMSTKMYRYDFFVLSETDNVSYRFNGSSCLVPELIDGNLLLAGAVAKAIEEFPNIGMTAEQFEADILSKSAYTVTEVEVYRPGKDQPS